MGNCFSASQRQKLVNPQVKSKVCTVNQSLLLHVVERLEGLVGKLPATIQKPILSELTPLKELFLQQRPRAHGCGQLYCPRFCMEACQDW